VKAVRVYRLDIIYPPGSHPSQPDYDPGGNTMRWPTERLFLSHSGAQHRAAVLRQRGAVVNVVPSRTVTW
jgi:hypothetical protein